ncbi:cytochrome c oxidase assembly factor CtaG [Bacillus alkalicellulosilyticus]|uniref:cytochrome c oxidase assembly factor CtaG n=1 Tax=Alkalihalobacterium alkalicellulosilyticum TaxID=1912214 RepID=UPI000995F553|nr:cytochrome c oxidase assembly factor CtaG [Bacillus alkalicellulosilyticus]
MVEQLFSNFGFRALWTPELIIILGIVAFLYIRLIEKWRMKFADSEPAKRSQKVYFFLGLVALYLGWGSPFYIAGHLMLTFHMVQMVFAYIVAVPLFILGTPKWFFAAIVRKLQSTGIANIGKFVFNPLVAVLLFNGMFSIYHLPIVFDTLMQNVALHSLYEYILFFGAFMMWWFMLAPLPQVGQLTDLRRMLYIFVNGMLLTPACALIIFSGSAVYSVYTDPTIWATVMSYCLPAGTDIPYNLIGGTSGFSPLSAAHDQQLGGVLMKVMQELIYGATIAYVFKQWISKEKQSDGLSLSDLPESMLDRKEEGLMKR